MPTAIERKEYQQAAKLFVRDMASSGSESHLCYVRNTMYFWRTTHWEEVDPERLKSGVRLWLDRKVVYETDEGAVPVRPDTKTVGEVYSALVAEVAREDCEEMEWQGEDPFNGARAISTLSGLLNPLTGELVPHTPRLFNTNFVNADYSAELVLDMENTTFLKSLFSVISTEPEEQIELIQEHMGKAIMRDGRYQSGLAIVGPRKSFKGTLLKVMGNIIGTKTASLDQTLLSGSFPLEGIVDCGLIALPDFRFPKGSNTRPFVDLALKGIAGDKMSVARKNKKPWEGVFNQSVWLLMNVIPNIPAGDSTPASRFDYVRTDVSFFGREDPDLDAKLAKEYGAIFAWAVEGYKRLVQNGKFTQTAMNKRLRAVAMAKQDPYGEFFLHNLQLGEGVIEKDPLFFMFLKYAQDNGMSNFTKEGFFINLLARDESVKGIRKQIGGAGNKQRNFVKGVVWQAGKEPTKEMLEEAILDAHPDSTTTDLLASFNVEKWVDYMNRQRLAIV